MNKKILVENHTPMHANLWLAIYSLSNLFLGTYLFFTHDLSFPHIAFILINLYSILLLFKKNRQGFYCLCSCELCMIGYLLITGQANSYFTILCMNALFILISWICARNLWQKTID